MSRKKYKRSNKSKYNAKTSKKVVIDEKVLDMRVLIILIGVIFIFSVLFFKLFQVMIVKNEDYKISLKELSYTIVEGSSAPRGRIYDRNYNIIVDNKAVKTIYYKKIKRKQ